MGVTEDLADELARDVIKAIEATGDEDIIGEITKVLGASSQTAEEAFLTALRVRRANLKARALLMERLRRFKADREAGGER
ncbi:MAG: hypothetical protein U5K36_16780 [Roseovarius sp.]|nr:hypothetical protein [Roseovarius sp.]